MSLCCTTCAWHCLRRPRRSVSRTSRHVRPETSRQVRAQSCARCLSSKGRLWRRVPLGHWAQATFHSCHSESRHCHCERPVVPGAGGCPLRPAKPGFQIHVYTAGQHSASTSSPDGLSLSFASLASLACARASSSYRENKHVCRLRGF